MNKQISFVLNDKGGVGKTTVCSALVEALLTSNRAFSLFDADRSNPDVRAAYKDITQCRMALFSEADRFQDSPNNIYNAAQDKPVLVNLPAQVQAPLFQWFNENEILEIAEEEKLQFYLFHITDGQYESINILLQYLEFFGDRVEHILVKNWGKTENWQLVNNHPQLQEYIHNYQIRVLNFPKFHGIKELEFIRQNRLSFSDAFAHSDFIAISRRRITRFMRETRECFAPIYHIFNHDNEEESSLTTPCHHTTA